MESTPDLKFEIGHVLFIDIVGYSKLLINQQTEQLEMLKGIVRGTEQFKKADAEGKLLRLPTGDGGVLVFRTTPESPALCALEISKALKNHPELKVRMGIHSGPVNEVTDLNEQKNIAGAGINIAQRVMDCGDAGHILLSQHVADDLKHYARWRPYLHEIGQCTVKHGEIISLVNLYSEEVGNSQRPLNIKSAAAVKSIAVLPFVNMSADKNDEYLSDGMTEELINALARVPGLRVPGRTSCFAFKSKSEADIFRKVGDQLHVDTVLEGSIRKAGDKLRVTAFFLIDSGEATVSSKGLQLATLGPGDYFGEIALIDGGPRSATVTAATDLVCYGLTFWEFRPLIERNSAIAWKLLQALSKRLRAIEPK